MRAFSLVEPSLPPTPRPSSSSPTPLSPSLTPSSSGLSRGSPRKGFSLVELSIVLVILGLLTGGILAGQSLIRAAELRSVTTEYQRWVTATQTFRDKYMAVPGDMNNATRFWGKDNAACSSDTGTAMTPGTCNGNSSSRLSVSSTGGTTGETFQFWKQLALAGLIEGNYSGLAGSGGWAATPENSPSSKLTNGYWMAVYRDIAPAGTTTYFFTVDYGDNTLQLGALQPANSPIGALLRPGELWNIDTKMDDGNPASGSIIAINYSTCTNAANTNDLTSTYLLTSNTIACAIVFRKAF